jgi:3-hydroxyacyl-CoA dehydrogenase
MTVQYEVRQSIAVLTMLHPPVNGLGWSLRKELLEKVKQALDDSAVKGIVLTGGNRIFSAGADIGEFSAGLDGANFVYPYLGSVIDFVESASKPVVAAISGACLGGGLELALGCHYRVADTSAIFALPEVKLGIIPGAGGTQRLPRAIGVRPALDMIVSGETINCERAASLGLVTATDGSLIDAAIAIAMRAEAAGTWPKVRDNSIKLSGTELTEILSEQKQKLRKPMPAMLEGINAVGNAVTMPFADGIKREFATIRALIQSPESEALRHVFFAERRAGHIQGVNRDTRIPDTGSVAVIGAGTMGSGIAMCCANAGIPVILLDRSATAVERGINAITTTYTVALEKGRLSQEAFDRRLKLISGTIDFSQIKVADLVIEAVFEDLAVKKEVFNAIDEIAKPGAVLASNTSTLDLNAIAAFTKRPEQVVGLHFFSPANVMRLLEVVRGAKTSDDVLTSAMAFARKIGKVGVVAGVCDGFIGNRMFEEYLRQAYFLLDEGATPLQIDRAMENWGMAMGPLATMDLAGNDIGLAIRKRRAIEQPNRPYSRIPDLIAEMGRFGQKTGAGWYRYDPITRKRQVDAEIDALIVAYAEENRIARRTITDDEIVARCVFALVNEGAHILQERIAQRASDIDVVYLNGYGFPAYRGGPMFYADKAKLSCVLGKIVRFQAGYQGDLWEPAPLLKELVRTGKSFADV